MSKPTSSAIAAILETAGREILVPAFLQRDKASSDKSDGSIVTETDLACQQHIRSQLAKAWPDIDFLGEEMSKEEQVSCLHSGGRFWCLDPLDGTTNFVASFPAFALSLALIEEARPTLACIVDPVRKETFSAAHGQGAFLNGAAIRPNPSIALTRPSALSISSDLMQTAGDFWPRPDFIAVSAISAPVPWSGPGWPPDAASLSSTAAKKSGTMPQAV